MTRVETLESALTASIGLLHSLVRRIETKFGPGCLGSDFQDFAASGQRVREFVSRMTHLISQGQQPIAARELRDFAGVTWDQAHDTVARWGRYSDKEQFLLLQLTQWGKSSDASEDGHRGDPTGNAAKHVSG